MSINDYRISKAIGKGAFATVYKAVDRQTSKDVAIKIFTRKVSKVEQQLAKKQIEITKQLKHPNIIRLFQQFRRNDTWYMVFEYCGRGDLEKLIAKKGRMSEELVSLIAVQLVDAVAYLQENNIAHRDIKLANVLVNDNFQIKLADLGFAKAINNEDQFLKSYAGTPLIMAPEIFDNGKYTNKCDIWSLGVIIYQMLHGTVPFMPKAGGLQALIDMIKNRPCEFPKDIIISTEARDFITKCLEKRPDKRPAASTLLSHPWVLNACRNRIQNKLPSLLGKLYLNQSTIFDLNVEQSEAVTEKQVNDEVSISLRKIFEDFTQKYQQSVQKFSKAYRQLSKILGQRQVEVEPLLKRHLLSKIAQINRFNLRIRVGQADLAFLKEQFRKPLAAIDYLKKLVGKEQIQENPLTPVETRILIKAFITYLQQKQENVKNNIEMFGSLLCTSFDEYHLQIKMCHNLQKEYYNIAWRIMAQITKEELFKRMTEKKGDIGISLMDVFDYVVGMPESHMDSNCKRNIECLLLSVKE